MIDALADETANLFQARGPSNELPFIEWTQERLTSTHTNPNIPPQPAPTHPRRSTLDHSDTTQGIRLVGWPNVTNFAERHWAVCCGGCSSRAVDSLPIRSVVVSVLRSMLREIPQVVKSAGIAIFPLAETRRHRTQHNVATMRTLTRVATESSSMCSTSIPPTQKSCSGKGQVCEISQRLLSGTRCAQQPNEPI